MDKKLYDLMDWAEIEAIVYSEHDRPNTVLGPHKVKGGILIQSYYPEAKGITVITEDGKKHHMKESDEAGAYAVLLPGKKVMDYTLEITDRDGVKHTTKDAYAYNDLLDANDLKRFDSGIHRQIYNRLGAHKVKVGGCGSEAVIYWEDERCTDKNAVEGVHFAVWAPNALRVSVVGDFNQWDGRKHMMSKVGDSGIFAIFVPGLGAGELYKYEIKQNPQKIVLKADPYGFAGELRPNNASITADISRYKWSDAAWMKERKNKDLRKEPMSVYEVHLGSWKKPELDHEPKGAEEFYNYREVAPLLAEYVKKMGYTHIELMPIMEHPLDESWGYQVTGYYAVTARYGSPEDFMYFMDYMHQKKIGVILDWVPAHFPRDEYGLACFDGTCLYEHLDPRKGFHPHWGTLIYNYARPQVANFLIANALFWLDKYHVDGIRMDAVASMLYLDYGRQDGEWIANMYGGNENLEAVEFLRNLNQAVKDRKDGAMVIAEESTAWPMITGEIEDGGLGFDFKWNMGWMNDFTNYMKTDPLFRKGRHGALTFSMIYAYSENFILVFSHDEVVHGKASMIGKMPGDSDQKFANLRVAYGYMMAHPGKKLLFMGQEFAQMAEWNEKEGLHWELLENQESCRQISDYVKELNKFYSSHPALYAADYDVEGFEWLSCMDADHSIVSFMRRDAESGEELMVVCNFTPVVYENFKAGVPYPGKYKEIFNSDNVRFGGNGNCNSRLKNAKEIEWDGREYSISITVPPLGMAVFSCTRAAAAKTAGTAAKGSHKGS